MLQRFQTFVACKRLNIGISQDEVLRFGEGSLTRLMISVILRGSQFSYQESDQTPNYQTCP